MFDVSSALDGEVDDELLLRAEREAMVRPEPCSMWDDRLYETHAPVYAWADRGDDVLAESNFHAMLDVLAEAAGADTDEHIIDASIGDWLVGSLRTIFVQVRNGDGSFTTAWRCAVECALYIRDFSVLDDDDYNTRCAEAWEEDRQQALTSARRYFTDSTEEEEAITSRVYDAPVDWDYLNSCTACDWEQVETVYKEERDAYFTELALEFDAARQAVVNGDVPGQDPMF